MKMKYLFLIASVIFAVMTMILGILSPDNSELYYAYGFSLGITIVAVIFTLVLFIASKKFDAYSYDERQSKARGECFKVSFFIFAILMIIDGILRDSFETYYISHTVGAITALMISIMVFVTIAIFKDAYFYVSQDNKKFGVAIGFTLIGLGNFIIGISNVAFNGPITDGMLNMGFLNIICAIMFAVIGIDVLIKRAIDKKQDSEEE